MFFHKHYDSRASEKYLKHGHLRRHHGTMPNVREMTAPIQDEAGMAGADIRQAASGSIFGPIKQPRRGARQLTSAQPMARSRRVKTILGRFEGTPWRLSSIHSRAARRIFAVLPPNAGKIRSDGLAPMIFKQRELKIGAGWRHNRRPATPRR